MRKSVTSADGKNIYYLKRPASNRDVPRPRSLADIIGAHTGGRPLLVLARLVLLALLVILALLVLLALLVSRLHVVSVVILRLVILALLVILSVLVLVLVLRFHTFPSNPDPTLNLTLTLIHTLTLLSSNTSSHTS